VARQTYEDHAYAGFVRRSVRALGRRAAHDPESLVHLVEVQQELDAAIRAAALAAHDEAGYSWTEIARVLGVTRQAARQRFAPTKEAVK